MVCLLLATLLCFIADPSAAQPFAGKPTFQIGQGTLNGVAFGPRGDLLVMAGSVGTWAYDAPSLTPIGLLPRGGPTSAVGYSPDGAWIVGLGSDGGPLWVWDACTLEMQAELPFDAHPAPPLVITPDSRLLLVGQGAWELPGGQALPPWQGSIASGMPQTCVPCTLLVAGACGSAELCLWSLPGGQEVLRLVAQTDTEENYVSGIGVHPGGRWLAAGYRDNHVRVWDLQERRLVADLPGDKGPPKCVAFSPDGRWLATAPGQGPVYLWTVDGYALSGTLAQAKGFVNQVQFTPTDGLLAILSTQPADGRGQAGRAAGDPGAG